jgi:hypothetical protein
MILKPFAVAIPAAILLAGCGFLSQPDGEAPTNEAAGPASAEGGAADAPARLDPYGLAGAPVLIEGGQALMDALVLKEGLRVELAPGGDAIILMGEAADARSGGRTGGVHIEISQELEAQFSGRSVEVLVVGRSDGDARLLAAYSTIEHPTSGWRPIELTTEFAVSGFTADIPVMENPSGDVVGFRPFRGPVEIAAIAIRPVMSTD